jgi:hypothetical protein
MGTGSEAAVGAMADSCDAELFSSPSPYWRRRRRSGRCSPVTGSETLRHQ